jgi:hypothetical protein
MCLGRSNFYGLLTHTPSPFLFTYHFKNELVGDKWKEKDEVEVWYETHAGLFLRFWGPRAKLKVETPSLYMNGVDPLENKEENKTTWLVLHLAHWLLDSNYTD